MNLLKRYKNHKLRKTNYVKYLRQKGISIGDNTKISNEYSIIDLQAPFLITIGNNVFLTSGHTILTHDYSRCVISRASGNVLGFGGPVIIKDNVFVGMHTTILPNTIIEENVIIGANSLVKGHLESGFVYAGNPAKKICSLEDYERKREEKQIEEAKTIALEYFKKYKKMPDEKFYELYDYQWLWSDITITDRFKNDFATNKNHIAELFMKQKQRPYKNYEDFIKAISIK
ncbi:MAG: acyltransferase [Bacteroidales bacterium]|nr:acyltransferase [Bacteroidales bacterium]